MASRIELPSPLGFGRQDEAVERGQDPGNVVAVAEEKDEIVDLEILGHLIQGQLERALADDDDLDLGCARFEQTGGFDQVAMAFAVFEIGDDTGQEVIGGKIELAAEEVTVSHAVKGGKIDARGE